MHRMGGGSVQIVLSQPGGGVGHSLRHMQISIMPEMGKYKYSIEFVYKHVPEQRQLASREHRSLDIGG